MPTRPIWGNAGSDALLGLAGGRFHLVCTPEIVTETRRKLLTGRHIRPKFAYGDAQVHRFCRGLAQIAEEVRALPPLAGVVSDANDDVIIATAVAAKADCLVTRDKDLLVLGSYQGIGIVTPEALLGMLRRTYTPSAHGASSTRREKSHKRIPHFKATISTWRTGSTLRRFRSRLREGTVAASSTDAIDLTGTRGCRDPRGSGKNVEPSMARLHHLLPGIYEAGGNPDRWPSLLHELARHLGGTACALAVHNFGLREGTIYQASGYDPDYVLTYVERYAARNVWLEREDAYRPAGTISLGQQLVPEAELVESEFYREWLKPQDLHHRLCGVIRRDKGSVVYLEVMRPRMRLPFGPDEIAQVQLLLPHLQQAVLLHRRLTLLRMERDAAKHALDLLPTGILLVDEQGAVLLANRRGEEILDADDGLILRDGTVRAVNREETAKLRTMVAAVVQTARGGATHAGGAVAVSRRSARRPLDVLVSPMRSTDPLLGERHTAAAVFVIDPELPVNVDEERLCQLYGLTRVEARLAWLIAQGESVEEAAVALRVAANTARGYLKRIFGKTGVRRQAELVRLLLIGPAQLRRDGHAFHGGTAP